MCYKKLMLVSFAFLAAACLAAAQNVTNVDANQEGKSIAVTYDLKQASRVSLFVTQDGGKTKTAVPQKFTSGDIGSRVDPGTGKKILWRVLEQSPDQNFQGENMSFIVMGSPCLQLFGLFNAGYSLDSGINTGFTIGQVGTVGWYVKVITTLAVPKTTEFECNENGYVNEVLPAYSGIASKFKAYGIGGVTVRLVNHVYVNAGIGYGARRYDWETIDGKWVRNIPGSYSGLAIDAGIMGRINKVMLSAGATMLGNTFDFGIGIGYIF